LSFLNVAGDLHSVNAALSSLHSYVRAFAAVTSSTAIQVSFALLPLALTFRAVMATTGARASAAAAAMVTAFTAGVGSALPAVSVATTDSEWVPSANPL